MYFNVNINVFFKLKKVHMLVSEIYIYQNARCNNKNNRMHSVYTSIGIYRVVPPDDEQQACSKHVEINY